MTDTAAVATWYNQNATGEHDRLLTFSVEYAVSLHTIFSYIETIQQGGSGNEGQHLEILDLGGGTGRYAVELARKGHNVVLADISRAELDTATTHAEQEGVQLATVVEVDAAQVRQNNLIFKEKHYDMILCLGPMYHLTNLRERQQLLWDCATMCKPGGYVMMAFVSRWGHLRDLVQRDPDRLLREKDFYDSYFATGVYDRVPTRTGHHVSVEEIHALFESVSNKSQPSLGIEKIVACESFLGGGISQALANVKPEVFQRWLDVLLKDAARPEVLGSADHLLVVAKQTIPVR